MLKSLSTSLIVRGLFALAVGIAALAWPGVTVFALVVLFAVSAFVWAAFELAGAFTSPTGGDAFAHVVIGLVDIAAGVVALAWPGPTALVLVLLVASWAIATGVLAVVAAFGTSEDGGSRAVLVIAGLVSVTFGAVLFAHPDMGAISLALLFGLFNLIAGGCLLVRGVDLRRTDKTLRSFDTPIEPKFAT